MCRINCGFAFCLFYSVNELTPSMIVARANKMGCFKNWAKGHILTGSVFRIIHSF